MKITLFTLLSACGGGGNNAVVMGQAMSLIKSPLMQVGVAPLTQITFQAEHTFQV